MENSNNIFGKFSGFRKKPQQPLTALTELYSKIANESIYYKKLEESNQFNNALQGWKALTTDAMFQLTSIDHHYPNTEHYTLDELSLLSGVRELYHKATIHMETIQNLAKDDPNLLLSNQDPSYNRYHTRDHKTSLSRMQPMMSLTSQHGFSRTTLRDGATHIGQSNSKKHSYSFNDISSNIRDKNYHQHYPHHEPKVNFSNSKPLNSSGVSSNGGSIRSQPISTSSQSIEYDNNDENNPFNNFDEVDDSVDYDDNNNIPVNLMQVNDDDDDDDYDDNESESNEEHMNSLRKSYYSDNSEFQENGISIRESEDEESYTDENGEGGQGDSEENVYSSSGSDEMDFDVSDYYDDIDNQNGNTTGEEYLELGEEDMARLQALDQLNGSPNRSTDISNHDFLKDNLSKLSISPSGSPQHSTEIPQHKEIFIPPVPKNMPPTLPNLPNKPKTPRAPVIIQPIIPKIQHKRHNLLHKNISSPSSSSTNAIPTTKSSNNVRTTTTTQRPRAKVNKSTPDILPSSYSQRPHATLSKPKIHRLVKPNPLASPSAASLASKARLKANAMVNASNSTVDSKNKANISATQVAKLVYKNTRTPEKAPIKTKRPIKTRTGESKSIPAKPKLESRVTKNSGGNVTRKQVPTTTSRVKVNISRSNKTPLSTPQKNVKNGSMARLKTPPLGSTNRSKSSSSLSSKSRTVSPVDNKVKNNSARKVLPSPHSRSKEKLKGEIDEKDGSSDNIGFNEDIKGRTNSMTSGDSGEVGGNKNDDNKANDEKEDEYDRLLKTIPNIDKVLGKQILQDIIVHGDEVHWDDIAGLNNAKNSLKEAVVYPFLRPDLFMGLRQPVTGMLLFGPPGTGKTMLARAVACESKSTFFSISASSLTSKYLGESEKLVRALFTIARKLSPSIIFVDEIDSILGSRNQDGENESSRRIKNEFLVQWSALSNAAAGKDDKRGSKFIDDKRVLVLAATNLPWSIDEAARRRFVRRQYIPLPENETRLVHIRKLLDNQKHTLTEEDFNKLIELTDGYSGSDITSLAKDAAMGPLRELGDQLLHTERENIRPIGLKDFENSLEYIKPSVSKEGLEKYEDWALQYGSSGT